MGMLPQCQAVKGKLRGVCSNDVHLVFNLISIFFSIINKDLSMYQATSWGVFLLISI